MLLLPHEPRPDGHALRDALAALAQKALCPVRPDDLDARDPAFIRRVMPPSAGSTTATSAARPSSPPSPGRALPRRRQPQRDDGHPRHVLSHGRVLAARLARAPLVRAHARHPFRVPGAGAWLNASGASPPTATTPGERWRTARRCWSSRGDLDACKPWSQRYTITFGKRRGFVRAAIRQERAHRAHRQRRRPPLALHLERRPPPRRGAGPPRRASLQRRPARPLALPWGLIAGIPAPPAPAGEDPHALPRADRSRPAPLGRRGRGRGGGRLRARRAAMQAAMDDLRLAGRHGLFPRG